mgnify:CR=1 FL=1
MSNAVDDNRLDDPWGKRESVLMGIMLAATGGVVLNVGLLSRQAALVLPAVALFAATLYLPVFAIPDDDSAGALAGIVFVVAASVALNVVLPIPQVVLPVLVAVILVAGIFAARL